MTTVGRASSNPARPTLMGSESQVKKHLDSLPFVPDEADDMGLVVSVIRVGDCGDWHQDDDGAGHFMPCWAVALAMGNRRHRPVARLMHTLDRETGWLIPSFVAVVIAVFNHESPFGLLHHYPDDPEAPQFVWFRDKLYERAPRTGTLTFVCDSPIRWTAEELGLS